MSFPGPAEKNSDDQIFWVRSKEPARLHPALAKPKAKERRCNLQIRREVIGGPLPEELHARHRLLELAEECVNMSPIPLADLGATPMRRRRHLKRFRTVHDFAVLTFAVPGEQAALIRFVARNLKPPKQELL